MHGYWMDNDSMDYFVTRDYIQESTLNSWNASKGKVKAKLPDSFL